MITGKTLSPSKFFLLWGHAFPYVPTTSNLQSLYFTESMCSLHMHGCMQVANEILFAKNCRTDMSFGAYSKWPQKQSPSIRFNKNFFGGAEPPRHYMQYVGFGQTTLLWPCKVTNSCNHCSKETDKNCWEAQVQRRSSTSDFKTIEAGKHVNEFPSKHLKVLSEDQFSNTHFKGGIFAVIGGGGILRHQFFSGSLHSKIAV